MKNRFISKIQLLLILFCFNIGYTSEIIGKWKSVGTPMIIIMEFRDNDCVISIPYFGEEDTLKYSMKDLYTLGFDNSSKKSTVQAIVNKLCDEKNNILESVRYVKFNVNGNRLLLGEGQVSISLIKMKTNKEDYQNDKKLSELSSAVWFNDMNKVQNLIHQGVSVNEIDEYGCSPLFYASMEGNLAVVKLLINSGADIFYRNVGYYGRTSFEVAFIKGKYDVAEYMLGFYKKAEDRHLIVKELIYVLLLGSKMNWMDVLDKTKKFNPDYNYIKDEKDSTLLLTISGIMNVAWHDSDNGYSKASEVCKELIRLGADVNKVSGFETVPLMEAARRADFDLVKLFVENGANVNYVNSDGESVLSSALLNFKENNFEIIKYLVEKGANTKVDKEQIVHLWSNSSKVMDYLVSKKMVK